MYMDGSHQVTMNEAQNEIYLGLRMLAWVTVTHIMFSLNF